jgi:hypothetical protein
MQHEVTDRQDLLDVRGRIIEEGWARNAVWKYDRRMIKASALRIKEWDYYSVMSHEHRFSVCVTFSDLGFAALFAIAFVDMASGKVSQIDAIQPLSLGKIGLPASSGDHSVAWANRKLRIACSRKEERRRLLVAAPQLQLPDGRIGIDADLTLVQPPNSESLNIATSWKEKRTAFYLNEKINCLAVSGTVRLGNDLITLGPHESFGVLDWGRGRWTYVNRWYWASASGMLDDVSFGFNLGYGFSDRSCASENAIIYDRRIHKLDEVVFTIPPTSYTDPWTITSNDNRFEMTFKPIVDRTSDINLLLVKSIQHQVFGYFTGTAVLDDGTKLEIKDFPGFTEDVFNRY